MKRRQFGRLLAGAGVLLATPAIVRAQGQNGVALVIGNSKYKWEAPLPNVQRDGPDVAKRFQALGLKTEFVQDLGQDAMVRALDKFKTSAAGAKLAAFYFAGHGVIIGEKPANFLSNLVPVDADLSSAAAAKNLVSLPSTLSALDGASHRLVVLDNCRNNPADGWRNEHLARVGAMGFDDHAVVNYKVAPNTLVLNSTAPGYAALDGPAGQNSPFAAAFLRQLDSAPVDLLTLPAKLRRDLLLATQCRQVLFSRSNYGHTFVLDSVGKATSAAPPSYDRSSVVELPNAYALAAQSGLVLPAGLVGYRPAAANPRDMQKVGAFKYEGPGGNGAAILIVLSVEAQRQAEAVILNRWGGRPEWRYVHAAVSGDTIEILSRDETVRFNFRWSDASSGSMSIIPVHQGRATNYNTRFARLDG